MALVKKWEDGIMRERIEELEAMLKEVLAALPSLTSPTTHQSVLYHETYIRVWNMIDGGRELERLFRICDWRWRDEKAGPGPGWACVHGFYMGTLNSRALTNLEGYHGDYLANQTQNEE